MIISAIICAASEALALKQRMQLSPIPHKVGTTTGFRGTCAETEDATHGAPAFLLLTLVREALALKQRMQQFIKLYEQ